MKNALIIVDVQNDFCPGGNLAVDDGARIIPNINALMSREYKTIVATQDWHPLKHISFATTHAKNPFEIIDVPYGKQMLWPTHCVQGTFGAELHKDLNTNKIKHIIRKGDNINIDSYSAFLENDKNTSTGLYELLWNMDLDEIDIVGIATDVCVLNTAMDAIKMFSMSQTKISVIQNCCAGVTIEGTRKAIKEMEQAGIFIDNIITLDGEIK